MISRAIISLALGLCTGCSVLKSNNLNKKEFAVENDWTRATIEQSQTRPRVSHRMKPIIFGNIIIQGNGAESIHAYQKENGKKVWTLEIEGGVEAGASLYKSNVYFGGNDGNFYSVDAKTGQITWKVSVKSQIIASPTVDANGVYFLSGNNIVYSYDHEGQQRWIYKRNANSTLSIRGGSRPLLNGNRLYIGMSDGYFVAIDSRDGQLIWERQLSKNVRFTDVDSTPVLEDGKIYVASYDGTLFNLSENDGQVNWRFDHGAFHAVTIDDGDLYFASTSGFVFALDKKSGGEKWRYKLAKGVATRPVLHRGLVVFGESAGPIRFLSARTGEALHQFHTGRGVSAEPLLEADRGRIYVISNDGLLFALTVGWNIKRESWPWL